MSKFWETIEETGIKINPDAMLYKAIPHFFLELMNKYFRVEVEGIENIPTDGRALIAPNHSGYAGLDAMLLSYLIEKHSGRLPKVMTHHFWFMSKATSIPAGKLGLIDATKPNGLKHLRAEDLVILFPEGEFGNFKPTTKAYTLQEFKRGFVRMALETKSPIVPSIVIGAEETHINLSQLKLTKYLRGMIIPLPLNVVPLPAKWKIKFLPPMYLPYKPSAQNDNELVHEICSDIRDRMQKAMNKEVKNRDSVYF